VAALPEGAPVLEGGTEIPVIGGTVTPSTAEGASASDTSISGPTSTSSEIDSKRIQVLFNALGLPTNISMSRLKFVIKAISPEMESTLATQFSNYKNSPKAKGAKKPTRP